MRAAWNAMERANLEEARAESDRRSLSQRADEAVVLYMLTLAELSARTPSSQRLTELLDGDPPISLGERAWEVEDRLDRALADAARN